MNAPGAAREYRTHGWAPIPIPPRSKNPQRKGWQRLRLDDAELDREFSDGGNIGNINPFRLRPVTRQRNISDAFQQ